MRTRKFVFTLQPLLGYRTALEDAAFQSAARCRHAYTEAQRDLERLDVAIRDAGSSPMQSAQRLTLLAQAAETQARIIAQRYAELESTHRELIAASTARRVIEKLKDQRCEAFLAAERRAERLELDEANARGSREAHAVRR
ncbi:MAG: hypothetical protein ABI231_03855 [Candidatus Tumulicola sp.]